MGRRQEQKPGSRTTGGSSERLLSLYGDVKPVAASKGRPPQIQERVGLRNREVTGGAASAHEEAAATFPTGEST